MTSWEIPAEADANLVALLSGHPAGSSTQRVNARLATPLWDAFPGQVALLDRTGTVVSVNRAWRLFALEHGGTAATGLGQNYLDICSRAASDGEPEAARAARLVQAALDGRSTDERHVYPLPVGDEERYFRTQAHALPGRSSGALVIHEDVTAEVRRERQLLHQASHDPLTGLPNRGVLHDRLEHAVASAARDSSRLAVLFVDLDRFKEVNENHGHAAGDTVLRQAAARLADSVRSCDTCGRWGGDEFLVIAERLETSRTATALARRLESSLATPVSIGGEPVSLGATIGLAHLKPGQDARQLVHSADQALARSRRRRRSVSRPAAHT